MYTAASAPLPPFPGVHPGYPGYPGSTPGRPRQKYCYAVSQFPWATFLRPPCQPPWLRRPTRTWSRPPRLARPTAPWDPSPFYKPPMLLPPAWPSRLQRPSRTWSLLSRLARPPAHGDLPPLCKPPWPQPHACSRPPPAAQATVTRMTSPTHVAHTIAPSHIQAVPAAARTQHCHRSPWPPAPQAP